MPALFVGHGNPMYAIENNNLHKLGKNLEKKFQNPLQLFVYLHIGKLMELM